MDNIDETIATVYYSMRNKNMAADDIWYWANNVMHENVYYPQIAEFIDNRIIFDSDNLVYYYG